MFKEINSRIVHATKSLLLKEKIDLKTSHIYLFYSRLLGHKSYQIAKSKNACFQYAVLEMNNVRSLKLENPKKLQLITLLKDIFKDIGYEIEKNSIDNLIMNIHYEVYHYNVYINEIYLGFDLNNNVVKGQTSSHTLFIGGTNENRINMTKSLVVNQILAKPKDTKIITWGESAIDLPFQNTCVKLSGIQEISKVFEEMYRIEAKVNQARENSLLSYSDFRETYLENFTFIINDFNVFLKEIEATAFKFIQYANQRGIRFFCLCENLDKDLLLKLKSKKRIEINFLFGLKGIQDLSSFGLGHTKLIPNEKEEVLVAIEKNQEFVKIPKPLLSDEEVNDFISQNHPIQKGKLIL